MTLGCFSFRGVFKSCSTPNDMCWLFFFLTFSHCFAVGLVHCDEHWETQDWANQQRTCACVFLSSPQHSRFFVCCFREVMIHDFKSYVKKTYKYMKLMECSTHAYGIIRVNFFSLFISFIVFFSSICFDWNYCWVAVCYCSCCYEFYSLLFSTTWSDAKERSHLHKFMWPYSIYRFKWTVLDRNERNGY